MLMEHLQGHLAKLHSRSYYYIIDCDIFYIDSQYLRNFNHLKNQGEAFMIRNAEKRTIGIINIYVNCKFETSAVFQLVCLSVQSRLISFHRQLL